MPDNLFFCRTPLQALIISRIIEKEKISSFDLLYAVSRKSEEHLNYYNMLTQKSKVSHLLEKSDLRYSIVSTIASYIRSPSHFKNKCYENVYLASIDSIFFGLIMKSVEYERLVTFDDGAANIMDTSTYRTGHKNQRAQWYRYVLGVEAIESIKKTSNKHYTIYEREKNIVDKDKTVYLGGITRGEKYENNKSGHSFFIGQPFDNYMNSDQMRRVREWVEGRADYYVRHPREENPLMANLTHLDKNGLIAEHAIPVNSKEGKPTVIGCKTSVLLNLSTDDARKIHLKAGDWSTELFERAGCEVVEV